VLGLLQAFTVRDISEGMDHLLHFAVLVFDGSRSGLEPAPAKALLTDLRAHRLASYEYLADLASFRWGIGPVDELVAALTYYRPAREGSDHGLVGTGDPMVSIDDRNEVLCRIEYVSPQRGRRMEPRLCSWGALEAVEPAIKTTLSSSG